MHIFPSPCRHFPLGIINVLEILLPWGAACPQPCRSCPAGRAQGPRAVPGSAVPSPGTAPLAPGLTPGRRCWRRFKPQKRRFPPLPALPSDPEARSPSATCRGRSWKQLEPLGTAGNSPGTTGKGGAGASGGCLAGEGKEHTYSR